MSGYLQSLSLVLPSLTVQGTGDNFWPLLRGLGFEGSGILSFKVASNYKQHEYDKFCWGPIDIKSMYNKIDNDSPTLVTERPSQTLKAWTRGNKESKSVQKAPISILGLRQEGEGGKKKACQTVSTFKPKLQICGKRDPGRSSVLSNQPRQQTENLREKLDSILDRRMYSWQQQHLKMMHTPVLLDKVKPQPPQPSQIDNPEVPDRISPYAQYYSTVLPKKSHKNQIICKNDIMLPPAITKAMNYRLSECISEIENDFLKNKIPPVTNSINALMIKELQPPPRPVKPKKQMNPVRSQKGGLCRLKPWAQDGASRPKKKVGSPSKQAITKDNTIDNETDHIYYKKIYSYLTFLCKVNYSNGFITTHLKLAERGNNFQRVKVYIGGGNNRNLLLALVKRRFWLEVTPKITSDTKFIWTQNSIKQIHQKQATKPPTIRSRINTLQAGGETTSIFNFTRRSPSSNMREDFPKLQTARSEHKLASPSTHKDHMSHTLSKFKVKPKDKRQSNYQKQNIKLYLSQQKAERMQNLLKNFKICHRDATDPLNFEGINTITNHIPSNSYIGSKKALFYTMEHYYNKVKKIDPFTILPKTHHFKSPHDQQYHQFMKSVRTTDNNKIWIVKPGECSNRGNGIYLTRTNELSRRLFKKEAHRNGQAKTTIVQEYIRDPLLYNGRKFDIRHFMMVTVSNGNLKAYWYADGYLRTSSEMFSLDRLDDIYVHLTNDAIQKSSSKYGRYENGNKLSYTEFQRYLDNHYGSNKVSFKDQIMPKMRQIGTDIIRANYRNLDRERRQNNFEIYGLDFMIDREFRPWLIEVNANPCLQISCPLLSRIIPVMVENSLRLGLDPLILPPYHYPPLKRYYLANNFLPNLRYQIIFDELEYNPPQAQLLTLPDDFEFDQPEDEYENDGMEIDLNQLLE